MSIEKYKLSNNQTRYRARFYVRNNDGILVSRKKDGFKTINDARKWELTHKHETNITASDKFSVVFDMMSTANQASPLTTTRRRNALKKYASIIWNKPIGKLTKEAYIKWRSSLEEMDLATRTKNDIIGYVKQVGKFAWEMYDIQDNTKVLKNFPKTIDDMEKMTVINHKQFKKILNAETDEIIKALLQLLFMTGCRLGEARALNKADFDGKQIHIYKSMRRYEESLKTTKTGEERWVPLDQATIKIITPLLNRDGKYLFGDFAPISLTKISDHFHKDLEEAGLPHMRIHDLRHSHVSMLWHAGVPIPEISKRVGHSSPKTTMERYAHIFDTSQSATLKYLNSLK